MVAFSVLVLIGVTLPANCFEHWAAVTAPSRCRAGGGIALPSVYSLGLGVPFVLTALFLERFLVHQVHLRRWSCSLHVAAAIAPILVGVATATGWRTKLSYRLLDAFPARGPIRQFRLDDYVAVYAWRAIRLLLK